MNIYYRVLRLVAPYWKHVAIGLLASLFYVFFNSASVWMTASFINIVFPVKEKSVVGQKIHTDQGTLNERIKDYTNRLILDKNPLDSLRNLCIFIFVTFFLKNIFFYVKGISFSYAQLKFITDLRNKVYFHIQDLPLSFFKRKRAGEIASIIINDVEVLRKSFSASLNKLIVEPVNVLAFMALLMIISWKLTLISLLILPLSGYVITKVGQSNRRKSFRTSRQIAGIMSILTETVNGIRIVKAFAMEEFEKRRFTRETYRYFQLLFRRVRLRMVSTPISETIGVTIGVVLLWFGGRQVLLGNGLSPEDFIRFILLLFAILNPIKSLNNVNIEIQQGMASAGRVFSLLDEKSDIVERPSAFIVTDFKESIVYDHVYFKYQESEDYVLKDISFEVEKGEVVAIVGFSGAGKSTLVDLLPRFYDVTKGRILVDGRDIRDINIKSLRSLMGIVTQETILFNDTVYNNIAYGHENIDFQKVVEAARAANALDFIEKLPDGWNTVIGDRGAKLSGGEAQRIAIARALLKNPPILILDEATSSLDAESEKKVQEAIEILMQDRTVFVIAHRLATVTNADKIIVLDQGRIVEVGSHRELLQLQGLYHHFYSMQNLGELVSSQKKT
ncbi:MAG: ABC transporter ATP-binding protein [Candidatus Neomarinimicrobiota bacterium]|nr:MAG: ABC transporter ATP-binding protein [Candidatus Neomarinimicrobiota bacterium]